MKSKNPLLLSRTKEEPSNKLENVVKMVHKLSNKIVDLEKDKGANSSRKPFKPFYKKGNKLDSPNHLYLIMLF